jgi:hypothetical protein
MPEITTPVAERFMFPRWANYLLPVIVIGAVGGGIYLPVALGFGASPQTLAVGYQPKQPVGYSHALHAGKLGLDCRYCHNTVEKAAFAALPPTQTCMNCHTNIKNTSDLLTVVRDSWQTGQPIPWVKIHNLPNYVYFNHSAHVSHGVGCVECHGRIDRMDVVAQAKPLSMGWCLECHRDPGPHLRPKDVAVTDMNFKRDETNPDQAPEKLMKDYGVRDVAYMQSCYTCHR